jgi:uncharacterized peroxidase-related enzyme
VADALLSGDNTHLTPREQAMLSYAEKMTQAPSTLHRSDVEALKNAGLTDREIHDVAQVAAYFAYANRITLGLGAELERDDGAVGQWPQTTSTPEE